MTEFIELTASLEDYMEAIYHIIKEHQVARVKEIAEKLKVKAASVTGALRSLSEKGLINYAPYEIITFTDSGVKIAEDVVRRHEALKDFFIKVLSIDEKTADEAACQMEHAITKPLVDRLIQFSEFIESCPRAGKKWIKGFDYYCDNNSDLKNCERCATENLNELKEKIRSLEGGKPMTEEINLKLLKPGEKARISKISLTGDTGKRFIELGLIPNSIVELVRVAPLGDPVDIKIRGYHLSLRKKEAEGIYVKPF